MLFRTVMMFGKKLPNPAVFGRSCDQFTAEIELGVQKFPSRVVKATGIKSFQKNGIEKIACKLGIMAISVLAPFSQIIAEAAATQASIKQSAAAGAGSLDLLCQ